MASKMAAKEERLYRGGGGGGGGGFIHKYIFKIFMSEICFNCNECLFLIYNI